MCHKEIATLSSLCRLSFRSNNTIQLGSWCFPLRQPVRSAQSNTIKLIYILSTVEEMSTSDAEGAGLKSRQSHTDDLNIGVLVATLPGAWRFEVTAWTAWPYVSKVTW